MSTFRAISIALLSSSIALQACSGGAFEPGSHTDRPDSGAVDARGGAGGTAGATGGRSGSSGRTGQGGDSVSTVAGGSAGQVGGVDASLGDESTDMADGATDTSWVTEAGFDAGFDAGGDGNDGRVPECAPDTKKCDGLNPLRCSSAGEWTPAAAAPCPFLCTSGVCTGSCIPGARRCSGLDGKSPQQCNDSGDWVNVGTACTSLCTNGACTGSCPPNATQCLSPTELQTCGSDGKWQANATTCVDKACVADPAPAACVGQCTPNANKCTADFQLQTCTTKGQWAAATACPNNKTCIDNACTGVCAPNSTPTVCSQNTPQFCNTSGQWENRTACSGNTPLCYAGQCVACTPGARRCSNGSTLQICSDQRVWTDSPCSGGTPLCINNACVACNAGDKRCANGSTAQTCTAQNTWSDSACVGATPVCVGNSCVACTDGQKQCSGSTPQTCSGNAWQNGAACGGDTPVCTNGTCGCTNGQSRCKDGSTPEFCVGNTWIAGNACSGNTPVCMGGSCKECTGTEARCTDNFNILQTCDGNGNWVSRSCAHTCGTGGHPHCNTPAQISGMVACGTDLTCGSGSEGCCASPGNFHCGACEAAEPAKTPFVLCDGNNDCGPNFCCMVAGPYVTPHFNTYCAADCGVSVQGAGKYYTCDPDFPACPAGKTCTPWKDAETVIHVCWPAN